MAHNLSAQLNTVLDGLELHSTQFNAPVTAEPHKTYGWSAIPVMFNTGVKLKTSYGL